MHVCVCKMGNRMTPPVIIVIPVIGVRIDVPISHSKHASVLRARESSAHWKTEKARDPQADTEETHGSRANTKEISEGLSERARARQKRYTIKMHSFPLSTSGKVRKHTPRRAPGNATPCGMITAVPRANAREGKSDQHREEAREHTITNCVS